MTYFQIAENMSAEQRADFDFAISQEPGRSHLRRQKGTDALRNLMGGAGRPPATKRPRG